METIGTVLLNPAGHCLSIFTVKQLQRETWTFLIKKIMAVVIFILVLPVSLIGLIIKVVGQLLPHTTNAPDDAGYKSTDPIHIELCYEQLRIFEEVCIAEGFVHENTNIPCFYAVSGSALGALRHKGIIPWDDDVDGVVLEENENRFLNLEASLQKKGILLDRTHLNAQAIYKLRFTDEALEKYKDLHHLPKKPESPGLDIFIWAKTTDNCYTYKKVLPRCTWPNEYFTHAELNDGIEELPFGEPTRNLKIPILKRNHTLTYLKRYYGDDCLEYGIKTHGHVRILNRTIPCIKFGAHRFSLTHSKDQCARGLQFS